MIWFAKQLENLLVLNAPPKSHFFSSTVEHTF